MALKYVNLDHIVVINGDSFYYYRLQPFFAFHKIKKAIFSITLAKISCKDRYGSVELSNDIINFEEKQMSNLS